MITPVSKLPPRTTLQGGRESYVAADMREFLRSKARVARLEVKGRKASCVSKAAHKYIRDHPDTCAGVKVALRSGECYLYHEGE